MKMNREKTRDYGALGRIWAPWRIQYMHQQGEQSGCFLCRALEEGKDRENLTLWRSEFSFCTLNRWPYNNGHLLVAPKAHLGDLLDLSEEELLDQLKLLQRCEKNLSLVLEPDGFNVGLNLGEAAGAGVLDHLHWHIVPRWNADSNFMPVVAATKVIPQALEELWELLRRIDTPSKQQHE